MDNTRTEESYCMESDCETPTLPRPLQEKELFILNNKSVRYKVLEFIGEGRFGKVAKCVNMNTNENTAIKILKDDNDYDDEVEMLKKLRTLDPDRNNLVRFMDSFIVDDKSCIAFECLDRSLLDFLVQRKKRLTLNEIRPITRQLLVALNALKGIGLLYTDLKHDNVMLVNHQDEPFRVKLIDFGLAMPASEVQEGMIVQPQHYRAPEVSLGLPISEAIDMWSLGCVLACLFFCQNIFLGRSTYDVMKTICCLLGQPQDHLLDAGKYTHQYFKRNRCTPNSRWRLKTPEEYKKENDDQLHLSEWEFDQIGNLADAVNKYSNTIEEVEVEDTRAFSNLLQMLLNPDAEMRITPQQALEHSFVTMSHLADYAHRSSYTQAAFDLMVVCPACDSDECHEHLRDFESNTESSDSGEVFSNVDNSGTEESYCIESNCDTPTSPELLQEDELFILNNKSVRYKVLEFIGEGSFGKVAKCVNMNTNENTAIKILKNVNDYDDEVEMLEKLRNLDPERNNLVRFMDSFIVDDKPCIAFECLDRSLLDFLVQRKKRLTLNEIRPITRQLLVAFNALKGIGLLHADLKVDNVMLVNHQDQPFRVKLIDFGLAMPASEVREGMIVQAYVYQAPEVTLGLPISEAIDMWSLGCLLACLFLCQNIFNGKSPYDVMKTICCLLGQPQDHLLDAGKNTHQYFKRERCTPNSRWRLKTPEEYDDQLQLSEWEFDQIGNLADAVNKYSNAIDEVEVEDTRAFLNLLQMLLNPDAEMRITPEEALKHSFVTMSHLADYAHRSSYTQAAFELMVVCPTCDSDECHEHLSDFESNTESSDSGEVFSNVDNSGTEESYCIESNCDTPTSPEPLQEDELFILHNKSVRYKVLEFIGEGTYGKVAKCVNMNTNENTAIKILKNVNDYDDEVEMLEKLRNLDPEKDNLVRFMDSFIDDDKSCIAFECLDRSLWDLMVQREERLTLNEIRPITRQLLVAFNALKGIGLLHADLKVDNVMLVNHQDEPFRVKLVDFGVALPTSGVQEGMIVQAYAYRAPEVSLGLPISEAIDMWSLGCLLATLFFCKDIFNGESSYDVMNTICCLLGQPQDHLLDAGKNTHQYFKRNRCTPNSRWRLKTPEEYDDQLQLSQWEFDHIRNLADAVDIYSNAIDEVEVEDTRAFLNLLQMLLNPDAEMRITPEEALEHSFVTMSHLADYAHRSSYTQAAFELMVVCPACDLDKCHHYLSDFESNTESSDSGEVFSNMYNSGTEESYCMGSNCDTPTSPEPLQEEELFILRNKSVQYKVLEFIGEGGFGKVAKCVNMKTNENTAIKILKDGNDYGKEVEMLEQLRTLDPEKNNLVRFMDSFIDDDKSCIAFELLDRSLLDLMLKREERLTLNEIRPITHQLLVALNALKGIRILHADLTLHNVMLVNHQDEPFRVKLIDFGVALPASGVQERMIVQPYAYRAPEVSLGLPISVPIDMWSLGCLLAALFFCQNIFNGVSSYDVMNTICCLLGQPQHLLLNVGKNTHRYFKRTLGQWRLKTPEEYKKENDNWVQLSEWEFDQIGNLADAVNKYSNAIEEVEVEDTRSFLSLLQMLLNSSAKMRIKPQEALEHSFVTMRHLADYAHRSSYTQAAIELMVVCPGFDSDKCHQYLSDFQSNMESSDSGEVSSNMEHGLMTPTPPVPAPRLMTPTPPVPSPRSETHDPDAPSPRSETHDPDAPSPRSETHDPDAPSPRSETHDPDAPSPRSETHAPRRPQSPLRDS